MAATPVGAQYEPDLRNLVAASPTKFGRVRFELEKHRMEGPGPLVDPVATFGFRLYSLQEQFPGQAWS